MQNGKRKVIFHFPLPIFSLMKGNLIIISSPSGGGKGTLINELRFAMPDITYSISYTTRAIRGGEESGREYFFIEKGEFERRIARVVYEIE